MSEQPRKKQKVENKISEEEFRKLANEHNELVETYYQYIKDLQKIDEVAELSRLYLPEDNQDDKLSKWRFGQTLMSIRKNLLKEQKEISQEISEGEIWKYVG